MSWVECWAADVAFIRSRDLDGDLVQQDYDAITKALDDFDAGTSFASCQKVSIHRTVLKALCAHLENGSIRGEDHDDFLIARDNLRKLADLDPLPSPRLYTQPTLVSEQTMRDIAGWGHESHANTRLIRAAPKMYALLKMCVEHGSLRDCGDVRAILNEIEGKA